MQKPMFTLPLPGKSCNYCSLHCSWQHIRCSGSKCQATESAVPSTVVAGALRSVVPVIGEDNEEPPLSYAASGKGDMNVMDLQAPPPTGQS